MASKSLKNLSLKFIIYFRKILSVATFVTQISRMTQIFFEHELNESC